MIESSSKRTPAGESHRRQVEARRLAVTEVGLLAGGITLFILLLYQMREFLNPILVGTAGVILLWPLRNYRGVRALMLTGAFLLTLWLLGQLGVVLAPFVLAALISYLFNPLVATLERRFRVPRWVSSLVVTLLVVGLFVLFVLLLVPSLVSQIETLAQRILGGIGGLRAWLESSTLLDDLALTGVLDKQEVIAQVTALVQEQATSVASSIPDTAQRLFQSLRSLIGGITLAALIPVALFYILRDYFSLRSRVVALMPTFGGRRDYLLKLSNIVGSYIRGQLTISAIAATIVSTLLLIFQIPFALLIGLLAGVLNMIPNLGIIITMVIGILIGVVFGDPWLMQTIIILAVLGGESLLEQTVLTPNILGNKVGLHPVLILLSLFVFGSLMGILGLLIAVPATALIVAVYQAYSDELSFELSQDAWQTASRVSRTAPRRPRSPETFGGAAAPTSAPDAEAPPRQSPTPTKPDADE